MSNYTVLLSENGTVAVDDTLLVKGAEAKAGSRMLEGFKPLFSAEAVTRLEKAGYTMHSKTHVGEFGLDLVGEFSNDCKQTGALRGAAASLVADGTVKAALAVDVNGAPRRAAMLEGVSFLKPTYGTVSRYGVISTAASGEQVGVYAKTADGIAEVMRVIAGHDGKDGTSLPAERYEYVTDAPVSGKRVAVVKELLDKADDAVKANVNAYADALRAKGVTVEEIRVSLTDAAAVAWQILMTAETCNNVSRYDGVKFGHRAENYKTIDELYVNSRTEGFNFLTKAVILYGSDVLSKTRYKACYDKSLRVRRVAAEAMNALFAQYDAVLTPVASVTGFEAFDIHEAFDKVFKESVFTAIPNLVGIPALVSGGVQLMGKAFDESVLLSLAAAVEKEG